MATTSFPWKMKIKKNNRVSSLQRSQIMRSVKGKDTRPELKLRGALHKIGFRYRLHSPDLPGKPDVVFRSRKKVIFVHGCFWHGHSCRRGARVPVANQPYWIRKIARNRQRDDQNKEELQRLGWSVLVVWECEIAEFLLNPLRLVSFLGPPGPAARWRPVRQID